MLALGLFDPVAAFEPAEEKVAFSSGGLTFESRLTVPPARANGWGVLLVGGGLANDLDWRIPPAVALDPAGPGDAAVLAEALAAKGFHVLRWSTLAVEDPIRDAYPERAAPRTEEELLAQTAAAIEALALRAGIEGRRVLLVGYSLGARRGILAGAGHPRVHGVCCLAGAGLARLAADREGATELRARAKELLAASDANGDGVLDGEEAAGAGNGLSDHDGFPGLREWELAASLGIALRSSGAWRVTDPGAWPEDRVGELAEVFYIGGAHDWQSQQGALLRHAAPGKVRLAYVDGLGHTLGGEVDGKFGRISSEVVQRVSEWARSVAEEGADREPPVEGGRGASP
ncbi:MAG: hypothetical protein SF028_12710 [Candidatus Sumerlaeia bacterium]|nr:hypothetical protein [Candidatus Sumerlaeia bacterium]